VLHWVFQRHVECILYDRGDTNASSGAIWKLLSGTGLGRTSFHVKKSAVGLGQVNQAEFDALLSAFKDSLPYADPSSINRTRSFTLIPIATAAALCRSFGRAPSSLALLRTLGQPVPEAWELMDERDQNAQRGEHDLLLDDQVDEAGYEAEEVPFATELTTMQVFESVQEDEGKMTQYMLSPVPPALKSQLAIFIEYRTSVFQAKRAGGAVVSLSAEADKKHLLRFIGWMQKVGRVPPGAFLDLSLLIRPDLAEHVEGYVTFLHQQQGLRFSTPASSRCCAHSTPGPGGRFRNWTPSCNT
jgi:hypothetical protein